MTAVGPVVCKTFPRGITVSRGGCPPVPASVRNFARGLLAITKFPLPMICTVCWDDVPVTVPMAVVTGTTVPVGRTAAPSTIFAPGGRGPRNCTVPMPVTAERGCLGLAALLTRDRAGRAGRGDAVEIRGPTGSFGD